MNQFLLIIFLVVGSENQVYELSGQYTYDQCRSLMVQRVNAARAARPGSIFTGQCFQMVSQ